MSDLLDVQEVSNDALAPPKPQEHAQPSAPANPAPKHPNQFQLQLTSLKEAITLLTQKLRTITQKLQSADQNTYQMNKQLEQQRRVTKRQLLNLQYQYQKVVTAQKEYQYQLLFKHERENIQQIKMELLLEEERIMRIREQELRELQIIRERERVMDGVLKARIYEPNSFVYDLMRVRNNQNVMLEHEIVSICQGFQHPSLAKSPIYGYKRYQSSYGYNGYQRLHS